MIIFPKPLIMMIAQKNLSNTLLLLTCVFLFFSSCNKRSGDPKVLVFSKTAGYHHESIPDGISAIQKLGIENGFTVDTTTNSADFNEENLSQYSAVIWLSTTGDVLDHFQEADFERYIQSGGGYVGIHAAADTEYHWGWYNRLAGAYFLDHPGINDPHPNVQDGTIRVSDKDHPSTSFLPDLWNRKDEWYSFKDLNPEVNVLMDLDEDSYLGGVKMGHHPIAWYHEYDGGRAFYTAGGHTKESYSEDLYLRHILEGIRYAIGDNKNLDYSKAKTQRVPDENRFEKAKLIVGEFIEPTEMTILPNLDILVAQRRGEIIYYKNGDSTVTEVAKLDVYWNTGIQGTNAEEGVLGLQKDPNYSENGYVFVFYSPADKVVNRLSRFIFKDGIWDMDSEKVILEFFSQRQICCHTGGSIAFDKDGLLYLSTGDNSTPFNQPNSKFVTRSYAPLDQRPGFEQYDAARSAGNSNDLRGKILRIRVNEDGSYDIPDGNLYPVGTEGTKPEIYVQGLRNPYRISIDQKTGFLYWGDVGPDASRDSLETRGPLGRDEVNQARAAGHFGWPFFIAENHPYVEFDFVTGKSGKPFDPENPVNNSVNNTGIKNLPPAQPAFIAYSYGITPKFPHLGSGGRNAMAGPVYYTDLFPAETRLPDYVNGKLLIYDWVRHWIFLVSMKPNGDFDKMEPFMPNTSFNGIIDMEVGPDGKIYLLEYGKGWFIGNPDAGLSRIDFNPGNRKPVVENLQVDKTSGALPFTATFTVDASDPENDSLTFTWDLGNGEKVTTTEPILAYTFKEVGDYDVRVTASDPNKLSAESTVVSVYAGNIAPEVHIQIQGNNTFYFLNQPVAYSISVLDPDDPTASDDLSSLFVSADYLSGIDQAEAELGHLVLTDAMIGKSLVNTLTCSTCHKENDVSIGPSFTDVSAKYRRHDDISEYLINKIQKGGGGVWGETVMPANPELKNNDAGKIVAYIRSLGRRNETPQSLPASGKVKPTLDKAPTENGILILSASFTDKGGENIKPLAGRGVKTLRNPKLDLAKSKNLEGVTTRNSRGQTVLVLPSKQAHFGLPQMDLTGVTSIAIAGNAQEDNELGYSIEIRLDTPDGEKIGETVFKGSGENIVDVMINPVLGGVQHEVYLVSKPLEEGEKRPLTVSSLELKSK